MIKRISYQGSLYELPHPLEMPEQQRLGIDWAEVASYKVMAHCINEQGGAQNAGNIHCERGRLYLCFLNRDVKAKIQEMAFRLEQLPPEVKLALLENWPQIWIVPQPAGGFALSVIAEIELDTSPKVMKPLKALAARKAREMRAAKAAKRKQRQRASKGMPNPLFDWGFISNRALAHAIGALIVIIAIALATWAWRAITAAISSSATP